MTGINFITLDKQIALKWLMKRDYFFYFFLSLFVFSGFVLSIYLITLWDSILVVVFNTFWLWFMRLQGALLAHDFSHQQVFKSKKKNNLFASIVWSICCWAPATWWEYRHNAHHKTANQIDADPDLDVPFAFGEKQVIQKKSFFNLCILPFQHIIFFPWFFTSFLVWVGKWFFWLPKHMTGRGALEFLWFFSSIFIYVYLTFHFLSLTHALIFTLGHLCIAWLYMSILFFPNHYGTTLIEKDTPYSRVYQILTSRNIRGKSITSFFLWGLNYQVEHHLYPTMPRNHLSQARVFVKDFCKKNSIRYHEVHFFIAFAEMFLALRKVAKKGEIMKPLKSLEENPYIWLSEEV